MKKVSDLISDERRERERQRQNEEREEQERIEMQKRMMEEFEKKRQDETTTSDPNPEAPMKPQIVERSGLCVICQDEEANIAIVDCGHLAMCRSCSELVMSSSKECPLCRTRIVTEARLLRIFKT